MKIVTLWVSPDEPCHGLREEPRRMLMPDGSEQLRWVQTVFVVRGDTIAAWTKDYGPAEDFEKATPLMVPSYGDDTVAQLQELAERTRHDEKWYHYRERLKKESTLIRDCLIQLEQNQEVIRNRSVFGNGINVQRNVYDSNVARRRLRDKVAAYTGIVPQAKGA